MCVLLLQATHIPRLSHPSKGMQLQISEDSYVTEYPVVIFNSLAWDRYEAVRVAVLDTVPPDEAYVPMARVVDDDGAVIPSQVHPAPTIGVCARALCVNGCVCVRD